MLVWLRQWFPPLLVFGKSWHALRMLLAMAKQKRRVSSTGVVLTGDLPNTREMIAFLAPFARGKWHLLTFQVGLDVLSIVVGLATPAFAGAAIDQAVDGRIGWGFVGLAGVMVASSVVGMAHGPLAARFGIALGGRLTRRMVAHALDIGLPGRRPIDDGDLLNRAGSLAPNMPGYPAVLRSVGTGLVMAAGSLAALLLIHWLFVVAWLVVVGLLALLARRLMAVLSAAQLDYDELNGRMVNAYTGALAGRRSIRAADTLEREVERITEPLPALATTARNILTAMGRGAVALSSADHGVLVATAVAGVWLLALGEVTPGALLAAVRYAQMAYSNVAGVFDNGWFHVALIRSQAARVMELVRAPVANPLSSGAHHRGGTLDGIELDGVSVRGALGYVVQQVDLHIPPGTTVALVGESGVGKTTLASLVGRLHDPDEGTVRIDGTPVAAWPTEALAQRVGYAFETPWLVGDTVRDAITLGTAATEEEVQAAARRVEADAFIRRLPHGYDTELADAPMSGGERQRLGLARAALRDSPILVLDDALSSLDVATAARVLAALRSLSASRTTVIVAHRASTAASADVVAWLVDGRIRRLAGHAELWRDPDYRAAFVEAGSDAVVDDPEPER